jgi:hypothetical protein
MANGGTAVATDAIRTYAFFEGNARSFPLALRPEALR